MSKDFWLKRWSDSDIPWHQSQIEPLLVRHFSNQVVQQILVPLCGKSLDLLWLAERASEVVGVELSPIACEQFFQENKIEFKETKMGTFKIYTGQNIHLWAGDVLEMPEANFKNLDFIYDRAALFALPSEIRNVYSQKLTSLCKSTRSKNFEMLLIGREFEVLKEGPPYAISMSDIEALYDQDFVIQKLDSKEVMGRPDLGPAVLETAYRLTLKH